MRRSVFVAAATAAALVLVPAISLPAASGAPAAHELRAPGNGNGNGANGGVKAKGNKGSNGRPGVSNNNGNGNPGKNNGRPGNNGNGNPGKNNGNSGNPGNNGNGNGADPQADANVDAFDVIPPAPDVVTDAATATATDPCADLLPTTVASTRKKKPAKPQPNSSLSTVTDCPVVDTSAAQSYIVQFKTGTNHAFQVTKAKGKGMKVKHDYQHVFSGMAVQANDTQLAELTSDPSVASVVPDGIATIVGSGAATDPLAGAQPGPDLSIAATSAPWGLDRTDQRDLPLDGAYANAGSGNGVTAYVIDTGILSSHTDFGGRVVAGYDGVLDGAGTNGCNTHGTHVAGTIGGTAMGMAKQVTLVPVRVLDCNGSGSWSTVIAGMDWIAAQHAAGTPAVANMSLAGGGNSSVDTAVANLINDGVTVVVAAGNNGADACGYSPARASAAITVAATDSTDTKPSWSNYGSCVDIFAPGASILSDLNTSDTATGTMSGTSMAAPHVAGAAALYLQSYKTDLPADVRVALMQWATAGKVVSAGAYSPNSLLYVGKDGPTKTTTSPTKLPDTPTGLVATVSTTSASLTWTLSANADTYEVRYGPVSRKGTVTYGSWIVGITAPPKAISGLKSKVKYGWQVRAKNTAGYSATSLTSYFTTL